MSLYYGFTRWITTDVNREPREWLGFDNYVDAFQSTGFRQAAWTSVVMTVSSVLLSVILGTLIALLLDRKFLGQGVVRTMILTPFLIMPVVAGLIWKTQMFNGTFGVLSWVFDKIGFGSTDFVNTQPGWAIVIVLVWQWTPFMMLIILAGLQGQSTSVLEAAKVDGASASATFFQITLPHLRRYLELGVLLGSIYLIQVYDHIVTITGGGPNSTNLPYLVFQRSLGDGNRYGLASAYAIIVVIATIVLANLGLRVLSGLIEDEDA